MTEQELEDLLELLAADISKAQSSIIESEKKSQDAVDTLESSVVSMTSKIKKILDANAAVVAEKESILQSAIAEDISRLTAKIDDLQQSITDTNHKLKRYFDKEKYAITKGIITKIIKEEKLHG
jgi:tetrahydromethanopterin S-methyltransferase subunit B